MSFKIPLTALDDNLIEKIDEYCTIKLPADFYSSGDKETILQTFNMDEEYVYLPLYLKNYTEFEKLYCEQNTSAVSNVINCNITLYTLDTDPDKTKDQDVVSKQTLKQLKSFGSVFLSLFTGYGKTTLGIYLSCKLSAKENGGKTIIICYVDVVNRQWEKEFNTLTDAKVQYVKGKYLDPKCDVYIMGVLKASEFEFPDDIRITTVIYDEAHLCTEAACCKALLKLQAKYLIGMSASYARSDKLHKLLIPYFGASKIGNVQNYITRTEKKPFVVRFLYTSFEPELDYRYVKGRMAMDWTKVINSLSYNVERQKMIAKLAIDHPDNKILILLGRIQECVNVVEILREQKELVYHSGAKITEENDEQNWRIIVGTYGKIGTGYNNKTLNMLILAVDIKDMSSINQKEGRIRQHNNLIIDVVDCFPTLYSHQKNREKWYKIRGATIEDVGNKKDFKTKQDDNSGVPTYRLTTRK